ncbi:hypothetical protein PUN28_014979 [Cardiocondyla obscurior]|uniref:Uncharacterized protein n=1 Tax=Cardiocondyla obscurior TaxID=286306 RepID=A0AAW2EYW1_9HYME
MTRSTKRSSKVLSLFHSFHRVESEPPYTRDVFTTRRVADLFIFIFISHAACNLYFFFLLDVMFYRTKIAELINLYEYRSSQWRRSRSKEEADDRSYKLVTADSYIVPKERIFRGGDRRRAGEGAEDDSDG